MLTESLRRSSLLWTTASCTEGKKQLLVMAELKKLPRSSWLRMGPVWGQKQPKLQHPAEPTTTPDQPPTPRLRGHQGWHRHPAASPGAVGSGWIPGTTCSTCHLGTPWGQRQRGAAAASQRGGHAGQAPMALQSPLTWAAGNEDIHFYLMEIPEHLQTAENTFFPGKETGSAHWATPPGLWRQPR